MDSFEQAKIAGAFLIAALAIVLPKTLIDMRAESAAHKAGTAHTADAKPAKPGEHVALTAAATGTAAAPAVGAAAPVDIFATVKPLLATAKPEGGAATFKVCSAFCDGSEAL